MNFTRICRICLQDEKETFDLFTSYYSKKKVLYSEMLGACTTLKLNEGDGLPRQICKDCCRQLKKAFVFNALCEESYKKLTSYLESKPILAEDNLNNVKDEDKLTEKNEKFKVFNVPTELKEEIKVEQLNEDSSSIGWETDVADHMLLEVLQSNIAVEEHIKKKRSRNKKVTSSEPTSENADENSAFQKVKKRGRRKKEYPDGIRPKSESKLPHQCDVCGKILSTRSNLRAHKICHTDLRPYVCEQCPAAFKGYSALFHHRHCHTKELKYHCEYCSKQFSRRNNLINHIKIHTGEKGYHCKLCQKSFVQVTQYSTHMKRHIGEKSFLCQDCGKGFAVKADLKVHQRVHNGEKPYSCQLCPKTFSTAGNLSIHVRFHNKDIRYRCETCNKGFISPSAYNVHIKRHKGQRDHLCYCGKTFFTSSALKQHKVTHTGEKKYQCKICSRKFSQTSHLNRHFKRDHASPNTPLPDWKEYRIVLNETQVEQTRMDVFNENVNIKSDGVVN